MEKTQFVLKGFQHLKGFRVFAFDAIDSDRKRTQLTVRTDLAMSSRYGIPLQDLPMLCLRVLEQREQIDQKDFVFTEEDMCRYANGRALVREQALLRKKPGRRSAASNLGAAWRGRTT
jgi:hypothetical protein